MYVSVTQFQLRPGCAEEAKRIWKKLIVPALIEQKGWRDASFTADGRTDKGMLFTLWESEDKARGDDTTVELQGPFALLAALVIGQPTRQVFPLCEATASIPDEIRNLRLNGYRN